MIIHKITLHTFFRISSPTKNTEITTAKMLKLNSFGGEITIKSLEDIRLETSNVSLKYSQIQLRQNRMIYNGYEFQSKPN